MSKIGDCLTQSVPNDKQNAKTVLQLYDTEEHSMPPADMPMNVRIPALALNNPGEGQIKKATDADVKLMALAVAETPTLNDAQFKQQ